MHAPLALEDGAAVVDGGTAERPERVSATVAPDRGRICVWQDRAAWWLANLVTYAVVQLVRADTEHICAAEVSYDDEGFAMLSLDSNRHEPEFHSALDLLNMSVYLGPSGNELVDAGDRSGADAPALVPLADVHTLMTLHVGDVRSTHVAIDLPCVVFSRPRSDRCHTMVSLSGMTKALKLDPRDARKGKWIHQMFASWDNYLRSLEGPGVLLRL